MRTFQINMKTQYALAVAFILNCIFTAMCHRDVYYINGSYDSSLIEVLTFQFNTYSCVYLLFLPVFIFVAYYHLKTTKINEFTITRYESRVSYFIFRENDAFLFTVMYRISELFVSSLIFILASMLNGDQRLSVLGFSLPMQNYLCINANAAVEEFFVFVFCQASVTILYFFFVQLILLSDFNLNKPFLAGAIPITINFIFLALIKADFWFEYTPIHYIMPHNYTFLEFVFKGNEYSSIFFLISLAYWSCMLLIILTIVFFKTKYKDYIFVTDDT